MNAVLLPIPASWLLALSVVLFVLGAVGVLLRRNAVVVLLSVEIMLNSANLALAAFSGRWAAIPRPGAALEGQVLVFFVIGLAAAEAAVGLALLVALYRKMKSIDLDRFQILRW